MTAVSFSECDCCGYLSSFDRACTHQPKLLTVLMTQRSETNIGRGWNIIRTEIE